MRHLLLLAVAVLLAACSTPNAACVAGCVLHIRLTVSEQSLRELEGQEALEDQVERLRDYLKKAP